MVEQNTVALDVTEKDLQKAADFLVHRHDEHRDFMKKDDEKHWKKIAEEVHEMKSDLKDFSDDIKEAADEMKDLWSAE
jgi:predicted translin family RNA/ssDNA-binding protein